MKRKKIEPVVIFEGREFFGIIEFDGCIVKLYTEPTLKGTFLTVIPISTFEYRKKHKTQANVEIKSADKWTVFNIKDDWGTVHVIQIHNTLSDEIEYARKICISRGLCVN